VTTAADRDLVVQTGRRPAGAGAFVQQEYGLLAERVDGMQRQEIDSELRDGWLATDVYRRYERRRSAKTPSLRFASIQTTCSTRVRQCDAAQHAEGQLRATGR